MFLKENMRQINSFLIYTFTFCGAFKDLLAEPTFCMGDPPKMENGTAVVRSRRHGHRLMYKCDDLKDTKKIPGNVTCHFGTWIGIPPKCVSLNDCQIPRIHHGSLNDQIVGDYYFNYDIFRYERIIQYKSVTVGNTIPSAKVLFLICENPHTFQGTNQSAVEVQCLAGRWNPDPVCLKRGHIYIPTTTVKPRLSRPFTISLPLVTTSYGRYSPSETAATKKFSLSTIPSTVSTSLAKEEVTASYKRGYRRGTAVTDPTTENFEDQCTCYYPFDNSYSNVVAHANGKRLNVGDEVQNGAKVIFRCRHVGYHHFYGPSEITCADCKPLHSSDFPSCTEPRKGNVVIIFDETVKVLENGTIEIIKGQNVNFVCITMETAEYPTWDVPDVKRISFRSEIEVRINDNLYQTHLNIQDADYSHEGKYHCYINNYEKTTLSVAVIAACMTKDLNFTNLVKPLQESIDSSKSLDVVCKDGYRPARNAQVIACIRGKWNITEDPCIEESIIDGESICRLPRKPLNSPLKLSPEKNVYKFGETLDFSCPPGMKLDPELGVMMCLTSRWSHTILPDCILVETYHEKPCFGDPPGTENGKAVIDKRHHGHYIWYKCQEGTKKSKFGNVRCHNGTWIGKPPECDVPVCKTKDLNFTNLVKPLQESIDSAKSLDVVCKDGYRPARNAQVIVCIRGKWNITEDPCIEESIIDGEFLGCVLDRSSLLNLHIEPDKPSYHIGESISLSCPPYEELIPKIERILCLGNGWSDIVPKCEEIDYFYKI